MSRLHESCNDGPMSARYRTNTYILHPSRIAAFFVDFAVPFQSVTDRPHLGMATIGPRM